MNSPNIIRSNPITFAWAYRLVDLALIAMSLLLVSSVYGVIVDQNYLLVAVTSIALFLFFSEQFKLYRSWRVGTYSNMAKVTLASWTASFLSVLVISFLLKETQYFSRVVFILWFSCCSILLMLWRYGFARYLNWIRAKGKNTRKIAILGVTDTAYALLEELKQHPEHGLEVIGFYDDREPSRLDKKWRNKILGSCEDAITAAKNSEFEQLYIALPIKQESRIKNLLNQCGDTTVDVHIIPDSFMLNLAKSRISSVGSLETFSVFESPHLGSNQFIKRIFDILCSLAILSIIFIPMVVIAIAIKLTSAGPAIFKQHRYGLDGKHINVWKFRSMTAVENGAVVTQAKKNDVRITKLGAFLRKTSLDELPQFINVLQGSMSIVGPRPHAVAHNEEYRQKVSYYMLRHKVKPGITGWAQINGWRGETDTLEKMEKRVEYDLDYMRNWSLLLDVKILFLTVFKGFVNKNAY